MATTQRGALLWTVHRLTAEQARTATDRELLEEFAAGRSEAAFAALVARHGPMVLRVCRRVLGHEQDAEDAFQATFLTLARNTASIRKREALACWLHGVAHRTALDAKRKAARRRGHEARLRPTPPPVASPRWEEVQAALDEEIQALPERYRSAFVLCVLEGRGRPEAAAMLGVKEGTVWSRLARARQLLRARLARRGIELSALLAALAVAEGAGAARVPPLLARATVRAGLSVAAGGPGAGAIPPHVAALAAGATRAAYVRKLQVATCVLLIAGLIITGAGVLARQTPAAGEPPAAGEEKADGVEVKGRVLGPDGQPFAGASLYLVSDADPAKRPAVRATSDADGRFRLRAPRAELAGPPIGGEWPVAAVVATARGFGPDWALITGRNGGELSLRLVPNDVTIRGRVLDLQGKPVAGAVVSVREVATTPGEDLAPVLKAWQAGQFWPALELASKSLWGPVVAGLPQRVTTGPDGRFRLPGAGRERLVALSVEVAGIATETIRVVPRPAAEVEAVVRAGARASVRPTVLPSAGPPLYGLTFDHLAQPARPVVGTVRDRETGRPLAGVEVSGHAVAGHGEDVRATTDGQGNYRLAGLPKAAAYRLSASPPDGGGYLPGGTEAAGGDGLGALRVDFAVVRGTELRGRVTDKKTGRPVPYAELRYAPLQGNTHPGASAYRYTSRGWSADGRGEFRRALPPGPGVLFAVARNARGESPYTQARLAPADKAKAYQEAPPLEAFLAIGGEIESLHGTNAYRLLDLPAAKAVTCDLELDPGLTRTGAVLGPDGRPLAGAVALGLTAVGARPVPLKGADFRAIALDPGAPRDLLFLHAEGKLAGRLTLRGDEKGAPAVRLEPWGALTGRLVDADGQPLAGARIDAAYPGYVPVAWADRLPQEVRTDR